MPDPSPWGVPYVGELKAQSSSIQLHDWSVLTRTARDAPLALHLHISKTGGTTLRTLGASLLNRTDCNWNLRVSRQLAARNSSCDFISIEAPAASLPWTWDDGVSWPERGFTVTVLRNPFEQWYSVVRHGRIARGRLTLPRSKNFL